MQLNPAEISELIKSRIEGLGISADVRNQGTVVSVTDGIVRVHGLSEAMQGEMLEFPATPGGRGEPGAAQSPGVTRCALRAVSPRPVARWHTQLRRRGRLGQDDGCDGLPAQVGG